MRRGNLTIADRFPEATILLLDLVGLTGLASRYSPGELIEILNPLFSELASLAERLGLETIKTDGNVNMAACGPPEQQLNHAHAGRPDRVEAE